jgi:hypothetical protein
MPCMCPIEFCSVCICNEMVDYVGMVLRYEANDHCYGLLTSQNDCDLFNSEKKIN